MTLATPLFLIPSAINHLLAQEPWARDKLVVHKGKTARLDFSILQVNLTVVSDGTLCMASEADAPSVTIRVKPEQFPLILQNRECTFSYVTVEGDADFANAISQVGQSLHWEAEEDLSKLFGDIAAAKMVAGVKAALHTAKATRRSLAENVAEYLLEENPMLVRPQSVIQLGADVAKLRDDVERLQKRIEKLEGRRR